MLRRERTLLALVLALSIVPFASQLAQAAPGAPTPPATPPGPPTIAFSVASSTQLTIDGSGFAPGAASVLLGSYGPLTVVTQTATRLVVTLPASIPAGNYALSVQIGPGKGNSDESVATIGGGAGANAGSITGQIGIYCGDADHSLVYVEGQSVVAYTGALGTFDLDPVPAGTYNIVIAPPGQAAVTVTGVVVQSGKATALPATMFGDPNCGAAGT